MKIGNPWRVLVFPAGTENGMEIWRALSPCKEVVLFAATGKTPNHATQLYGNVHVLPDVRYDGRWLDKLNEHIRTNFLDFVFPANDYVIDEINRRREEVACPVLLPPSAAVKVVRSKTMTKRRLRKLLPTAGEVNERGDVRFPVIVKPDDSYGAQNVSLARNAKELQSAMEAGMIAEEYLPGAEFSVDCFTDRHGEVRFCGGRERERVRMGTSMRGRLAAPSLQTVFCEWARLISGEIGMRGAWFFQAKEDEEKNMYLTEVDARIAGTMALNRVRGVNFPLLSLYDAAGMDIDVGVLGDNSITIERALLNRYSHRIQYETVYVDWDDTIVLRGRLNLNVVRFLFQCVDNGIRIILITQSQAEDLTAEIARHRLSELFDEIIRLPEIVGKETRINPCGAIFIDDSFSHRQAVERIGVPSFSPDMVEMLLDDRI